MVCMCSAQINRNHVKSENAFLTFIVSAQMNRHFAWTNSEQTCFIPIFSETSPQFSHLRLRFNLKPQQLRWFYLVKQHLVFFDAFGTHAVVGVCKKSYIFLLIDSWGEQVCASRMKSTVRSPWFSLHGGHPLRFLLSSRMW